MESLLFPDAPSLVAGHGRVALLNQDGEIQTLDPAAARRSLKDLKPPLLVHLPATLKRLGGAGFQALDILELFLFVLPATPAAPTAAGLARALDFPLPASLEAAAILLPDLVRALLGRLAAARHLPANRDAAGLAAKMGDDGWPWARFVCAALGDPAARADMAAMRLWKRLPEWEDEAPRPPPSSYPVEPNEARARLAQMLGAASEQRPTQADFSSAAASAFAPGSSEAAVHAVLAEAGTGTGKTLAYLAPATLWAERNQGAVWISTFTKHLQRQIESELARIEPDARQRRRKIVLRKGRENYLCLLNYEDQAQNTRGQAAVGLGLIARWAMLSADGDVMGGDLPGWFAELFGPGFLAGIADRRGECIHAACPHWRRCTIEHVIRRARQADIVIANHALVMAQAVWGGLDEDSVPTRYVFDEGHHIFDAADSAFSAELSGAEMAELRRWLLGAEGTRSRSRGLAKRLEDLVAADDTLAAPLDAALIAARALPAPNWQSRLAGEDEDQAEIEPGRANAGELLVRALRVQARARVRAGELDGTMPFEVDLYPVEEAVAGAALNLARALERLVKPLGAMRDRIRGRLDGDAELDEPTRLRLEGTIRSLKRRALEPLAAWVRMLASLAAPAPEPGARPDYIQFLRVTRDAMADRDVALLSHHLDPTQAFAQAVMAPAHGVLMTSATLRDDVGVDEEMVWRGAEARTGAVHLAAPAIRAAFASPFDYAAQTRVFVVRDMMPNNLDALATAYRALFLAAGGGALGLFTAISRLRAVHARIAPALEQAGIPLYAQHADAMDNATLVDVFRAEENSCLLGTDAMRDGVDVPGNALRLVVFERTPWPRPDILHRVRRTHLADGDPKNYDERIARLRLRQAFGRLIRRADDRGVFVLLDRATPTRLLSAFPAGVAMQRSSLADTIDAVRDFLRTG
ncbi:MAG: DNA helicase [Rhodospirillales bacterium 20-60-12]|nr:MAG: DNA helicase [Rhodospirillales bacterium 20-60-12]HQT67180.1 ATP-dependent DNA helicase [Acetobacteraceae bacterium]